MLSRMWYQIKADDWSLECLYILRVYFSSVKSGLENASVVCNSITSSDPIKLEWIQQNLAAIYDNLSLTRAQYAYARASALEQ
jgi:hypothetical protein